VPFLHPKLTENWLPFTKIDFTSPVFTRNVPAFYRSTGSP
jgi:hypothetical protein